MSRFVLSSFASESFFLDSSSTGRSGSVTTASVGFAGCSSSSWGGGGVLFGLGLGSSFFLGSAGSSGKGSIEDVSISASRLGVPALARRPWQAFYRSASPSWDRPRNDSSASPFWNRPRDEGWSSRVRCGEDRRSVRLSCPADGAPTRLFRSSVGESIETKRPRRASAPINRRRWRFGFRDRRRTWRFRKVFRPRGRGGLQGSRPGEGETRRGVHFGERGIGGDGVQVVFVHRSATLSFALCARGLARISSREAVIGFFEITVNLGSFRNAHFTRRSSKE